MTNEELIAQARELCEQQIADHAPRESWTVENYPASWRAYDEVTLNSWTTHLAEMDEHKVDWFTEEGFIWVQNLYCVRCNQLNPCQKLLTKAKRLLGVE